MLLGLLLLGGTPSLDSAVAQVPRLLHYQATLVEQNAPPNGTVDLSIAFFSDSTGGTPLGGWSETHTDVELTNGRVNLLLGRQTPLPEQLFEASRLYLEVTVNGNTLPRLQMASTPYALQAAVADSLSSHSVSPEALEDGAVTSRALADGAVTEQSLSEGAVTSSRLAGGAVTAEGLASRAVTREKLAAGAVGEEVLSDGAVSTSTLSDDAVREEKIDEGQVVKTINGLTDEVQLVEGDDISITTNEEEGTIRIDGNGGIFSSRRWKTDIRPLEKSLSLVQKLRGVRYRWKESGEEDLGLIAEEVGKVLPQVVNYAENGEEAESVEYARLVAVLIEAIKTQQEQLEAERAALEGLERRVEHLEKQALSADAPER